MSRVCEIYGKRVTAGGSITRKGLAKKVGGIGTHVVKNNKRIFVPNIQKKRFFIESAGVWITLRVSAKAIRTINKKGLIPVLREAKNKGFLTKSIPGL